MGDLYTQVVGYAGERSLDGFMSEIQIQHPDYPDVCSWYVPKVKLERLTQERENWIATSQQGQRDIEYYQGLLDQCGKSIGKEAYTQDDGNVQESVLRAKVPELVAELVRENARMRSNLANHAF